MMPRHARQMLLLLSVFLFGVMFIVTLIDPRIARDPRPPRNIPGMAAWLARHPADWITASALADAALYSNSPKRFEIWRAAHDVAHQLAPLRPNATAAFVRGGLYNWNELSERDRAAVLDAAVPLLHDPAIFGRLHAPLWRLTRDFAYIRRNAPPTLDALDQLSTLAGNYALFDEYRSLRADLRQRRLALFQQQRAKLSVEQMIRLVPRAPATADEPLLRAVLEELARRSFGASELRGLEALTVYAVEHDLRPLDGLAPLVQIRESMSAAARARLALELNDPAAASAIELTAATAGAPEWKLYHIERMLFEARRRNRAAVLAEIRKASIPKPSIAVLTAAEKALTMLGDTNAAREYSAQLRAPAERQWRNACSAGEICDWVSTDVYGPVSITLENSQSDQFPPYVEIYVDDRLAAEGEVTIKRTFNVPASDDVHEIEVRLVNNRTRNGLQRRLRLS